MRPITAAAAALAAGVVLAAAAPPPPAEAVTTLCAARPSVFGPASRPFAPARQLASVEAARPRIAFAPRLLPGRPFRVYVSRERLVRQRRLGLAYRRSSSSWVVLTQLRATTSRARFEAFARELSLRYECGDARTLRLRDGSLALLLTARDRRVLRFRSGGIDLVLLASPSSASAKRLVALANALT